MMVVSVYSPDDRYDQTYLANYTNLYLLDPIKRLPGANLSTMFPVPEIAMRIWLKPDRLAQLGITTDDVSNAIQRQNKAYGIGQIGQAPTTKGTQQSFVVTTQGMLTLPKDFDNIILRTDKEGAAIVRLKDVGHAELGGKDYSIDSKVNGKRAVDIVVYQQPGANAIETSKEIRKLLKELTPRFPAGLEYKVVLDTSKFTEASIEKVVETFFEAVFLVVLVVFLFLQSFRATLIPILAVPIAIVGTYSGILMLGFSTNMLTLFGMILAIGLVVDDAIIVVENVEHLMAAQGLTPMEAAKKAMGELAGALIATSCWCSARCSSRWPSWSLERTVAVNDQGVALLKSNPAVSDIAQLDGFSLLDGQNKTNAGMMFTSLKPYDERKGKEGTAFAVIDDARRKLAGVKEGLLLPLNPPSIPGLGTTGGFEFYMQD